MKFHKFSDSIEGIDLPQQFTFPFCYTPHPLSIMAAQEVQAYLKDKVDLTDELKKGKMFGVLVVQNKDGEIGFLAAFSGILAGTYIHDYFVPPIYDLLNPDGFFKLEEDKISHINNLVSELEMSSQYKQLLSKYTSLKDESEMKLAEAKHEMKISKEIRDRKRASENLSETESAHLIKESQFQKAEYKRLVRHYESLINDVEFEIDKFKNRICELKEKRKMMSGLLQKRLFEQFRILNAKGETRDLNDIFIETPHKIPPAGAGECSAPKLLQYAYKEGYTPLSMAEFWWGESSKSEMRIHGHYYPSCRHKCEPILGFILQGLDVEPNPLMNTFPVPDKIDIIYEDEYMLIVNKPAGMLSVPGKNGQMSVTEYLQRYYPNIEELTPVHRLDMDTSGLLLVAKNKDIYVQLQELFEKRKVKKRYVALLDGVLPDDFPERGFIKLPLRPDYDNRPYQLVDEINGKMAITRYEVLGVESLNDDDIHRVVTKVRYFPETGRTHQLRVHSAHSQGMNIPIAGDPLYGQKSKRMYLHAERLEFRHPVLGSMIIAEAPFRY